MHSFYQIIAEGGVRGAIVRLDGIAVPFIGGVFPDRDKADDAKAPQALQACIKLVKTVQKSPWGGELELEEPARAAASGMPVPYDVFLV